MFLICSFFYITPIPYSQPLTHSLHITSVSLIYLHSIRGIILGVKSPCSPCAFTSVFWELPVPNNISLDGQIKFCQWGMLSSQIMFGAGEGGLLSEGGGNFRTPWSTVQTPHIHKPVVYLPMPISLINVVYTKHPHCDNC